MSKVFYLIILIILPLGCQSPNKSRLKENILSSLGNKFSTSYQEAIEDYKLQLEQDSSNIDALIGLAESNIMLFLFGYASHAQTVPVADAALMTISKFDSTSTRYYNLLGMLSFIKWDWEGAQMAFQNALKADPDNNMARHWYSLWLSAMKRFDEAMAHSDTILTKDPNGNYRVGRGSLFYFRHDFSELKRLMLEEIKINPTIPWGYDWLGMAHNGLKEHDEALDIYFQAFDLSDGTVEVGGGLGHALGEAGEYDLAKKMADYYTEAAKTQYLPPVQRAFVHVGIGEHDKAIKLLEQAFDERSWFIIFIQIEPWYDPLREDARFQEIINKMKFPG